MTATGIHGIPVLAVLGASIGTENARNLMLSALLFEATPAAKTPAVVAALVAVAQARGAYGPAASAAQDVQVSFAKG